MHNNELHDAFKDLHDELMKIGKKNICLKKKMIELKNENESFSAKIACLELENKTLHDNIVLFENSSTPHEHLSHTWMTWKMKMKCLERTAIN